jgi:hypothetical protein
MTQIGSMIPYTFQPEYDIVTVIAEHKDMTVEEAIEYADENNYIGFVRKSDQEEEDTARTWFKTNFIGDPNAVNNWIRIGYDYSLIEKGEGAIARHPPVPPDEVGEYTLADAIEHAEENEYIGFARKIPFKDDEKKPTIFRSSFLKSNSDFNSWLKEIYS